MIEEFKIGSYYILSDKCSETLIDFHFKNGIFKLINIEINNISIPSSEWLVFEDLTKLEKCKGSGIYLNRNKHCFSEVYKIDNYKYAKKGDIIILGEDRHYMSEGCGNIFKVLAILNRTNLDSWIIPIDKFKKEFMNLSFCYNSLPLINVSSSVKYYPLKECKTIFREDELVKPRIKRTAKEKKSSIEDIYKSYLDDPKTK